MPDPVVRAQNYDVNRLLSRVPKLSFDFRSHLSFVPSVERCVSVQPLQRRSAQVSSIPASSEGGPGFLEGKTSVSRTARHAQGGCPFLLQNTNDHGVESGNEPCFSASGTGTKLLHLLAEDSSRKTLHQNRPGRASRQLVILQCSPKHPRWRHPCWCQGG